MPNVATEVERGGGGGKALVAGPLKTLAYLKDRRVCFYFLNLDCKFGNPRRNKSADNSITGNFKTEINKLFVFQF